MSSVVMQRPGNGVLSGPPPAARHVAPRGIEVRPTLPERHVTSATIDDAYVSFVLYCNPAVPLDTDTAALREAFRTPPKSGGKSFSTFTLFVLIRRLESKEIKTWAELALKLGVEPPDQEKGQSSQRIQQYAVRLKRWMHSMHVDAFFEYLLNHEHPYWTQIPTDPNPVSDILRDGVAAEDDMALRALLPQIRPKRGRKRPEDDDTNRSPSQRPRMDSPPNEEYSAYPPEASNSWPPPPDGPGTFLFPPPADARLSLQTPINQHISGPSWAAEVSQTPLTAYPQSAITPSTRHAFWGDEPRSAISPSKPRINRRHGAKAVSSAWRSGGPGGTGKTRGRPPINRPVNDGSLSAYPTDSPSTGFRLSPSEAPALPSHAVPTANMSAAPIIPPPAPIIPPPAPPPLTHQPESAPTSAGPRPPKPRGLSLQVPPRIGREVRLATPPPPPPPVTVNGGGHAPDALPMLDAPAVGTHLDLSVIDILNGRHSDGATSAPAAPAVGGPQRVRLEDPADRTNMDELEAFFVYEITQAEWVDARGAPIPAVGVDEARAVVATVIGNLLRAAPTKEAFLINLAALAGGKILKTTTFLRCIKLDEADGHTKYICHWQLRYGDIMGQFSMKETVRHDLWKKPPPKPEPEPPATATAPEGADEGLWQRKYHDLLKLVEKKDKEIWDIKEKVLDSIKDSSMKPLGPGAGQGGGAS